MSKKKDDKMIFYEPNEHNTTRHNEPWKILIVDDELIVHESTKMVLSEFAYNDKPLMFISAFSSEEAKVKLEMHDDIAVVLLDVVMETYDSGLKLVEHIRNHMNNRFTRIILRTGQPGQAPEEQVVIEYDINDYKMKTELTMKKLITTIVSALRSYSNIIKLERNRKGLEDILALENDLYELHDISIFANLLLFKVNQLYNLNGNNIYLRNDIHEPNQLIVIAATGLYEPYIGRPLPEQVLNEIKRKIKIVDSNGGFIDNCYVSCYKSLDVIENYIYFDNLSHMDDIQRKFFEILISNLSVAIDNIALNEKMVHTQSELINRLSEVIEARSEETASHVERVSQIAYMLAKKTGLSESEAQLLKTVAPLHDVGKIGIPEAILNKPGQLTSDEFEVIKKHALIGYRILKGSGLDILEAGALVAKEHHEYWNGKGYPNGLSGDQIHIYGRITLIADVFDALSHERVYKKAWSYDKVVGYMKEQSGQMFDPNLINVLLANENELKMLYKLDNHI